MKKSGLRQADSISGQLKSRKNLVDSISSMYGEETSSDFTFIVKEKEFKVNKSILAASSAVMQKLFTAEYKEKETSTCNIVNIEPNIFEALIRFMYSCPLPVNLSDIAVELYSAAHYYEIQTLKEICLEEIQNNLSSENVIVAHDLAFKYNLEELSADSWEIIKRDILKVYLPKNVKPLSPAEVAEILALRETEQAIYDLGTS